jgi:hypothetical protein
MVAMTDKELLRFTLSRSFDHFVALQIAMQRIEKEDEGKDKPSPQANALSMIFSALNDVIHPLYPLASDLFPDKNLDEFIVNLKKAHQYAAEKKLFPPCSCEECKNETKDTTKAPR